jgi:hypothetical protein
MSLPTIPGQGEHFPARRRQIDRDLVETCQIVYFEPIDPYSEPPATPQTTTVKSCH